jgi:hypothetical protein
MFFFSNRETTTVCGMEVRGSRQFRRQTRDALSLLQPLPEFDLIQSHLAEIRQGNRSGVTAWAARPVFTVGAPTWTYSPLWYAGAIAHDAFHAKLYRDAKKHDASTEPDPAAWSGQAAESVCLTFQRRVLVTLKADKTVIDYVEKHAQNPTYQGRSKGLGGWLDYRKRWW